MTSRERLLTLLRGEPTDRIGVYLMGVRPWTPWWMAGRHPSYLPLVDLARQKADVFSPIGFETGFYYTAAPVRIERRVEPVPGHGANPAAGSSSARPPAPTGPCCPTVR